MKRIVGCPCGYVCVNGGSSTTEMPGSVAVDEEQRRPLALRVRHDDVDRRDVAVGDEPLLAVDHPAAVAPPRRSSRCPRGPSPRAPPSPRRRRAARRAAPAAASGRSARASPTRARCRRSGCATTARWSSARTAPRPAPTRASSSPGRRARARAGRRASSGGHRLGLDARDVVVGRCPRAARPSPRAGSGPPRRSAARGLSSAAPESVRR